MVKVSTLNPWPPFSFNEQETLVQKARKPPPPGHQVIEPTRIAKNIRKIGPRFSIDQQEDAHEFLRTFIDAMQRCCPPVSKQLSIQCQPYPFSLFAGSLVVSIYHRLHRGWHGWPAISCPPT